MTRPPPCSTLFPYTTLFRSWGDEHGEVGLAAGAGEGGGDVGGPAGGLHHAHEQHVLGHPGLLLAEEGRDRSEEHTSELQSLAYLVCRLLLEKKKHQAKQGVG